MEHDVAVRLENHEQQIKSLKHRMDNQEEQDETMRDLVISVKLLATNMENMLKEQEAQSERLSTLEKRPAEQWNTVTKTAITAIVSAFVGGAAVAIMNFL